MYIRKNPIIVHVDGTFYLCEDVVNLANLVSRKPGSGALKRLVADLVLRKKAVYVENVHESWFRAKLLERGFIQVDEHKGYHFLFNYVGHLTLIK